MAQKPIACAVVTLCLPALQQPSMLSSLYLGVITLQDRWQKPRSPQSHSQHHLAHPCLETQWYPVSAHPIDRLTVSKRSS